MLENDAGVGFIWTSARLPQKQVEMYRRGRVVYSEPLNTVYRLNTVSVQKTDRPAFVMGISNPLESDHWAPYENEMKNGHAINHEVKAGRREKEREGPDIASKANR